MIGPDTNVIVRYLTQDDPEQAEAATRLIESQCSRETPGHITLIVLCELVWVLRKAYGYNKTLVISARKNSFHKRVKRRARRGRLARDTSLSPRPR